MTLAKAIIGALIFAAVITTGALVIGMRVESGWRERAGKQCRTLGAELVYIENNHYVCVTDDGRIVGHR